MAVADAITAAKWRRSTAFHCSSPRMKETGSTASRARHLAGGRAARARVFVLVAGEGGAAKIARKGTGLVAVNFSGVAAHAGLEPEKGASALLEMSRFAIFADLLAHPGQGDLGGTHSRPLRYEGQHRAGERRSHCRLEVLDPGRVGSRDRASTMYVPEDPRIRVTAEGGLNRPHGTVAGKPRLMNVPGR